MKIYIIFINYKSEKRLMHVNCKTNILLENYVYWKTSTLSIIRNIIKYSNNSLWWVW